MAKPAALVRFGSYGIPAQFGTPPPFIIPSEISVYPVNARFPRKVRAVCPSTAAQTALCPLTEISVDTPVSR